MTSAEKKSKNCLRPKAVTKYKVFRGSDEVNWGKLGGKQTRSRCHLVKEYCGQNVSLYLFENVR